MAWYSILPPALIHLESWAARIFMFLGLITIGPWAALIIFDAGLYLCRMLMWEIPVIGGRAQGEQRPRAPSLNERPDGQRRAFGLRGVEVESDGEHGNTPGDRDDADTTGKEKALSLAAQNQEGRDLHAHSSSRGDGDGEVTQRISGRT